MKRYIYGENIFTGVTFRAIILELYFFDGVKFFLLSFIKDKLH